MHNTGVQIQYNLFRFQLFLDIFERSALPFVYCSSFHSSICLVKGLISSGSSRRFSRLACLKLRELSLFILQLR